MKHFVIGPGLRRVAIASHARVVVVGIDRAEFFPKPGGVIVVQAKFAVFPSGAVHVAVVQDDVVKSHEIAPGIDVHFADALGVITCI